MWPITRGEGVTLAVVDSGTNAALPEFEGAVVPGFDATGQGRDGRQDVDTAPDAYGKGGWGHGTAMASLIAAQGGTSGMVGVAPGAKLLPIIARQGDEYATGIRWAVDHGAQVINVSSGQVNTYGPGRCVKSFQDAVDHAVRHDVVVVAASGNDGSSNTPTMPGGCPGVLTVGAIDHRLQPWTESTPQKSVDVAAPGVNVANLDRRGRLVHANGTSASTALTSAVVALVRSKHPKMPAREVVQRIIATAKDAGPGGWDDRTGYGVVNPHKALTAAVPTNAPNPVYAEWDKQHEQNATSASGPTQATADEEGSALLDMRTLSLIAAGAALITALVATSLVLLVRRRNTEA